MSRSSRTPRIITLALFGLLLAGLLAAPTPAPAEARAAPGAQAQAGPGGGPIPLDRPLRFERLTLSDGLSQNSILSILQDRYGYLWLGTQDGLNRYDGYTFTVFKNDPDNPDSLSNNGVISLFEDRSGILWIGTWGGGLNSYDPDSGHFTRYQRDPADSASLGADIVPALLEDSAGRLWVGTSGGGLNLLNRQTGKFTRYLNDPGQADTLSSDAISTLLEDPSGALWVGTGGFSSAGSGLNRFDPRTGKAQRYQNDPKDLTTLNGDSISGLQMGKDGKLWVATGGYAVAGFGLNHFDPKTGLVVRYQNNPEDPDSLSADDIYSLHLDSAGLLWVATYGGGLDRADTTQPSLKFVHSHSDPFNLSSLSSDQLWGMLEDRSGVMWVGSVNGGLNKLNPQVQRFRLFRNNPNDPNSLSLNAAGSMIEDNQGRVWVGTYGGGLNAYLPKTGIFTSFETGEKPSDIIMSLRQDSAGTMWVGSIDGLASFDPSTAKYQRMSHDPADPASLVDNNVSGLIEDSSQHLWVGTLGGLDILDRSMRKFTHIQIDGLGPVVTLFMDRKKMLWVGTWGSGLYHLDPSSAANGKVKVLDHFLNNPADPTSLSDNSIWSMYEDPAGWLWLATTGGLNRYDPVERSFKRYREKNGLANDSTLCILPGGDGKLWISTNSGISRFDPQTESFRTFDVNDGLQSNEFNSGSCLRTRSGELFFGGVNGLSAFDPAQIQDNPTPPPVVISAFRIFNEPFAVDQSGGTPVNLSYRQNFISFEFAALDFHAPLKNQYAYRLDGFDKDWVQAGNRRYASYTNLNGGDYTFRVMAANSDGVWSSSSVAIPIHITPPFYATLWFLGGVGLLVLMSAAAAVRWRLDLARDQNRRLESLVSERTTSLRETNLQLEVEVEQRKRAEEALSRQAAEDLRLSEARFRAMFENAAVGIGLMNLDRKILECNDAVTQIFGFSPEEFQDRFAIELIHPDDRGVDAVLYQELVDGKRLSYQAEKRYQHKDGRYIWAKLILSAVRGPDGEPLYLLGMIVDIDEQKRVEQELDQQEALYRKLLEQRVYERTLELRKTNEQLQQEIDQRVRVEEALSRKAAEEAVVIERNRLARDLHDAVTQTLFSASLLAEVLPELFSINPPEAAKRLEELRQLTRGALAEMRTLLVELRPSALTDIPLADLLRQLAEATIGRARLPVELRVDGEASLPPDVQVALYRIVQEALNNVVKYAKATQASVSLRMNPESVRLTVIDNGIGFEPENVPANHFGLRIMRERAEAIGARVSVYSEPGQGTQITAVWSRKGPTPTPP